MADFTSEPQITHATGAASLLDVLDRILDKGVVIAGDIRIKLVDVELLTIHIRLLVCSVDKAKEMGMDWWLSDAFLSRSNVPVNLGAPVTAPATAPQTIEARMAALEHALASLVK